MKKLIGLVAALAVMGAVLVPFASAEEKGTLPAPAAATEGSGAAAGPETQAVPVCGVGAICSFGWPWFEGGYKITSCQNPGAHGMGGTKASIINECLNVAVWMRVNGNAVGCKNPGTSNNNSPIFNELWVGKNGSRC